MWRLEKALRLAVAAPTAAALALAPGLLYWVRVDLRALTGSHPGIRAAGDLGHGAKAQWMLACAALAATPVLTLLVSSWRGLSGRGRLAAATLLAFGGWSGLAAACADRRGGIWGGVPELFDGLGFWLACPVFALAAMLLVAIPARGLGGARALLGAIALGLLPVAAFACIERAGWLEDAAWMRRLILPSDLAQAPGFELKRIARAGLASTMVNPNHLGAYAAALATLATSLLASRATTRGGRWLLLLPLAAVSCALVWAGRSRGAQIGLGAGMAWVAALTLKDHYGVVLRGKLRVTAVASATVLLLAAAPTAFGPVPWLARVWARPPVTSLRVDASADHIGIAVGDALVRVSADQATGYLRISDRDGKDVQLRRGDDGTLRSLAKALAGLVLTPTRGPQGLPTLRIAGFGGEVEVIATPDGPRVLAGGAAVVPRAAERIPLPISDAAATGRGFIWTRALAVALRHPWLGVGPGGFLSAFPQDDVNGRLAASGNARPLIDKAHSLFLQIWLSLGAPALLIYLALVMWLVGAGARALAATPASALVRAAAGTLLAVCVTGLATDLTPALATLTWSVLGLGIGAHVRSSAA